MALIDRILVDGAAVPKNQLRSYLGFRERPSPPEDRVEIIAHRGFMGTFPENTMAAFNGAAAYGARSLECDVRVTSDGALVVIHDATVDRTTNGSGAVASKTLAQMRTLDAGTKFSPIYAGTRVPTYEEVLDFARTRAMFLYVEIKGYRTAEDIDLFVQPIIDRSMQHKVMLCSFNHSDLARVREVDPFVLLGYLDNDMSALDVASAAGNASLLLGHADVLANPGWVNQARAKGVDIACWTVPDSDIARRLLNVGVRRIISDTMLIL